MKMHFVLLIASLELCSCINSSDGNKLEKDKVDDKKMKTNYSHVQTVGKKDGISFETLLDSFKGNISLLIDSTDTNTQFVNILLFEKMYKHKKYEMFNELSIHSVFIRSKNPREKNISVHLINCHTNSVADSLFKTMQRLVNSDSYYEKPFSMFFINGSSIYLYTDIVMNSSEFAHDLIIKTVRDFCLNGSVYYRSDPSFYRAITNCTPRTN